MWTIEKIEGLGFKLVTESNRWCHFRGHGFDMHINLGLKSADFFNFHSTGNSFKGSFKARIGTEEDFKTLLKLIV